MPKDKDYPITSVCKDDLRGLEKMDKKGHIKPLFSKSTIDRLSDADMKKIASKMADDYCEQLFWGSLEIIAEHVIESKKNKPYVPRIKKTSAR